VLFGDSVIRVISHMSCDRIMIGGKRNRSNPSLIARYEKKKRKTRAAGRRKKSPLSDKKLDRSLVCFRHGMARVDSPLRGGHGNHVVTAGNVSSRVWRTTETRLGSSPVLNYVVSRVC